MHVRTRRWLRRQSYRIEIAYEMHTPAYGWFSKAKFSMIRQDGPWTKHSGRDLRIGCLEVGELFRALVDEA